MEGVQCHGFLCHGHLVTSQRHSAAVFHFLESERGVFVRLFYLSKFLLLLWLFLKGTGRSGGGRDLGSLFLPAHRCTEDLDVQPLQW